MPKTVEELEAESEALQARIDELSQNITDGLEGERTWTTSEIAAFRAELADLKATTAEVMPSLTASLAEMREQLTQLSQEMQQRQSNSPAPEPVPTISPPPSPTPEPAPNPNAPTPKEPKNQARGKNLL